MRAKPPRRPHALRGPNPGRRAGPGGPGRGGSPAAPGRRTGRRGAPRRFRTGRSQKLHRREQRALDGAPPFDVRAPPGRGHASVAPPEILAQWARRVRSVPPQARRTTGKPVRRRRGPRHCIRGRRRDHHWAPAREGSPEDDPGARKPAASRPIAVSGAGACDGAARPPREDARRPPSASPGRSNRRIARGAPPPPTGRGEAPHGRRR